MFADSSVDDSHAKPSSTISMPVRFAGSRRQAYRPVPMKPQPTAGPKIANAALASWWSLDEHQRAHGGAREQRDGGHRVHPGGGHQRTATDAIACTARS